MIGGLKAILVRRNGLGFQPRVSNTTSPGGTSSPSVFGTQAT